MTQHVLSKSIEAFAIAPPNLVFKKLDDETDDESSCKCANESAVQ